MFSPSTAPSRALRAISWAGGKFPVSKLSKLAFPLPPFWATAPASEQPLTATILLAQVACSVHHPWVAVQIRLATPTPAHHIPTQVGLTLQLSRRRPRHRPRKPPSAPVPSAPQASGARTFPYSRT